MAVERSTEMLNVKTSSRASQLPQGNVLLCFKGFAGIAVFFTTFLDNFADLGV